MTLIGLSNYAAIFESSSAYLMEVGEFALLTLIRTPMIISFSLMMALMINKPFKGRALFRMLMFLPVVIVSGAVMTMLTNRGLMSMPYMDTAAATAAISGALPEWLANAASEFLASVMAVLWNSGVQILLFLSGMQKVSSAMYDAAKIDGASAWECLWKITLPVLRPIILLASVFTIVSLSAQPSNATISMITDAMYGMDLNQGYGYASAMAWLYLVVIAVLLAIAWLLLKAGKPVERKEYAGVYARR